MKTLIGFLSLTIVYASSAAGTQAPSNDRPVVSTTAHAEVRRAPDFATLAIGVSTLDSTATAASTSMNAALQAVFDTLIAMGIPRDSLPSRRFSIQPEYNYDGQRRLVGYGAHASVTVTVTALGELGVLIEGALAAGATDVGSITFGIRDDREARDEALRLAVEDARRDAAVLAAASGRELGAVREVRTGEAPPVGVEGMIMQMRRQDAAPIVPADVVVRASVTASWYLQP